MQIALVNRCELTLLTALGKEARNLKLLALNGISDKRLQRQLRSLIAIKYRECA